MRSFDQDTEKNSFEKTEPQPGYRYKKTIWFLYCWVVVLFVISPSSVLAAPLSSEKGTAKKMTKLQVTQNTIRKLSKKGEGLPGSSKTVIVTSAPPPLPKAVLVLEGISATVTGVGLILLGIGASNIGIRNQISCLNADDDSLFGACEKGSATEIKQLEDSGLVLLTAGWISLGVGITGMVVGGIWMLTHNANPSRSSTTFTQNPGNKQTQHTSFLQNRYTILHER